MRIGAVARSVKAKGKEAIARVESHQGEPEVRVSEEVAAATAKIAGAVTVCPRTRKRLRRSSIGSSCSFRPNMEATPKYLSRPSKRNSIIN